MLWRLRRSTAGSSKFNDIAAKYHLLGNWGAAMALAMRGLQRIGRLPVRYKLLGIAAATGVLSLLILSAAFIVYHTSIARSSLERELAAAAEIAGTSSTAALLFGDRSA